MDATTPTVVPEGVVQVPIPVDTMVDTLHQMLGERDREIAMLRSIVHVQRTEVDQLRGHVDEIAKEMSNGDRATEPAVGSQG